MPARPAPLGGPVAQGDGAGERLRRAGDEGDGEGGIVAERGWGEARRRPGRGPGKAGVRGGWGCRGAAAGPGRPGAGGGSYAGDPEEYRLSNGDSTSTDFVRSTNGSPAILSSTLSKCRMSDAKT